MDSAEIIAEILSDNEESEKSTPSQFNVVDGNNSEIIDSQLFEPSSKQELQGDSENLNLVSENREDNSDNQDDDIELRWEDDDLDGIEIKNEDALLEDPSDSETNQLSLQDKVIKNLEEEEELLNLESEMNPSSSLADNLYMPKAAHNLNKPDMMLEIPTNEVIEFSDDEGDLTNNLEMSPDSMIEDELLSGDDNKEMNIEIDNLEENLLLADTLEDQTCDINSFNKVSDIKEDLIVNTEIETKLAADILTRELSAMDGNANKDESNEVIIEDIIIVNKKSPEYPEKCIENIDNVSEINCEYLQDIETIETDNTVIKLDSQDIELVENIDMYKKSLLSPEKQDQIMENLEDDLLKDITEIDTKLLADNPIDCAKLFTNDVKEPNNDTSNLIQICSHKEKIEAEDSKDPDQNIISRQSNKVDDNVSSDVTSAIETIMDIDEPKPSISFISQEVNQEIFIELNIPKQEFENENDISVNQTIDQSINESTRENSHELNQNDNQMEISLTKEPLPSTSEVTPKELRFTSEITIEPSILQKDSDKHQSPDHQMEVDEPQPSTSELKESIFGSLVENTSKNVPEMMDSLGLLAESSRMMEDDEEQDYYDEGEDDDDFDQDDESSNQMTAEHSEDSSAQHSESEVKDVETPTEKDDFQFTISEVASEADKHIEYDEPETTTDVMTDKPDTSNEIEIETHEDNSKLNDRTKTTMDVETLKISDASDNEVDGETGEPTILKAILSQDTQIDEMSENSMENSQTKSPSKTAHLTVEKQDSVMNFVDLEESSSEEDGQESKKEQPKSTESDTTLDKPSDLPPTTDDKIETVDSEVTQLAEKTEPPHVQQDIKQKPLMGLEVFSLDSDEEEQVETKIDEVVEEKTEHKNHDIKCINKLCPNDIKTEYYIADTEAIIFYDADKKKRGYVCGGCADAVQKRNQELIEGIQNFTPLLELSLNRHAEELVEISDSESEEEPEPDQEQLQIIGEEGAKIAEEKLASIFNETWEKFKMDDRLMDTQNTLQKEMEKLQKDSQEINELLNECQVATDQLRNELYATFEPDICELPPFVIYDTPNCSYSFSTPSNRLRSKRNRSPSIDQPTKRPAIPMGYTPLDDQANAESKSIAVVSEKAEDDSTDVSVVKLSAESAPKDLPPPGEITTDPLKAGMTVYAMKNAFRSWLKAKVIEVIPKSANSTFTSCRVKFEHKVSKNPYKVLPARCLAYFEPPNVRMTIGRRVIALFKDSNKREAYYSGIVAEIPNPVNSYRYLIFFDDGYAQYAQHAQTRLVCECSPLVWEEVHPFSREFVRQYLFAYPERPMVRLHEGQNLKTEWRGRWWSSRVSRVDASLVEVVFIKAERREWIYRGSTRLAPLYLELQAAERQRPRAVPRAQPAPRSNMPYVEYTRSDEQTDKTAVPQTQQKQQQQQQQNDELRRQRAVAKKSTASAPAPPPAAPGLDSVTSRVVYYTPKNAVKPYKMVPHNCSSKCKRTDTLALKDLRTYNPLAKPLLSGWERQIVRWKGHREVLYVAPCGRRLRDIRELHTYLRAIRSDMPVDLFDFSPSTHCLAEFVLNKCFVGKKDLSHGKENVPVPCVNYYDESLPEFCSYNTERTPTAGVPLNLDPEFLCGCDCENDCEDKSKCACWQMTLEGARTIGLEGDSVGYVYKRLPDPLPSGIYECNSRCKCKNTCLNRVAQHPLQLKLQVFKTVNRGWGIRALNDVPKGAFLCVYAGNLLTDATANLDGLNEGDEYLAELDYIEVVEQMKEGYEEDIPEKIKQLDKKETVEQQLAQDTEDEPSSEEERSNNQTDPEDDDFQPGYIGMGVAEFNKRLRRRDKNKKGSEKENEKETNPDDECITISDDEEVREPSCFTAAAGMGANEFISKYRSVRSLFGSDEACYIMDAKVQGNIGRYLNHSCSPNVFVQNVFVDTHDPRFPWVAFFALCHIRAGTELTWNYNYDVGSVPGKVLYCHCGASNCRGRLL